MRNPFRKRKKISIVKKSRLTRYGWEIWYHVEIEGVYVPNSTSSSLELAERFFNRVVNHVGKTEIIDVIKTKKI